MGRERRGQGEVAGDLRRSADMRSDVPTPTDRAGHLARRGTMSFGLDSASEPGDVVRRASR